MIACIHCVHSSILDANLDFYLIQGSIAPRPSSSLFLTVTQSASKAYQWCLWVWPMPGSPRQGTLDPLSGVDLRSLRCLYGLSTSWSLLSSVPGYWVLLSDWALSSPDDESAERWRFCLRVSLEAPASLAVRRGGIDLLPDLSTQTWQKREMEWSAIWAHN